MAKIIIEVCGGVVRLPIQSNISNLEIYLINHDVLDAARGSLEELKSAKASAVEPIFPQQINILQKDFPTYVASLISCYDL